MGPPSASVSASASASASAAVVVPPGQVQLVQVQLVHTLRSHLRAFAPTAQEAFQRLDRDGDGMLSRQEFEQALLSVGMGEMGVGRAKALQRCFSEDGMITFYDFEVFWDDGVCDRCCLCVCVCE